MKLRHTAIIAALALGMVGITTSVAAASHCDETVNSSESIQAAINSASSGVTICVAPGTYNEDVNVDKDVTVTGLQAPEDDPATVDGLVDVSAEGAQFNRMKVAPSQVYSTGLDPAGILVTASDTEISDNVVEGMTANASNNQYFTVHGIQVWNGDQNDPVSNVKVVDNTVQDVQNYGTDTSYGGAVGIKVQGVVEDIKVAKNTVENVHSAGWTYGVVITDSGSAPGVSPENVKVVKNTLDTINDGSVYNVSASSAPYEGNAFAIDGAADADEAQVHYNNFLNVPNGALNKDTQHTLDAENNYWGHASGPENRENPAGKPVGKGAAAVGDVDWRPYLNKAYGQASSNAAPQQNPNPPMRGPR